MLIIMGTIKLNLCQEDFFLKWIVKSTENSGTFIIQRTDNGKDFDMIGSVNNVGTKEKVELLYCFTDDKPMLCGKTQYRIMQISMKGIVNFSNNIEVSTYNTNIKTVPYVRNEGPSYRF